MLHFVNDRHGGRAAFIQDADQPERPDTESPFRRGVMYGGAIGLQAPPSESAPRAVDARCARRRGLGA
jgi:hypothetical protein